MNNLIDWVLEKETPEIQIKSPKVKALMYCKESVEKIGFTWEEVMSKNRKPGLVDARRCVSRHLLLHGFTTVSVGEELNLDHSTIVYHKKKFKTLHEYDASFRHTWAEFSRP